MPTLRTYNDLTPEEQRTLVDGRDVTDTIDPLSYGPATSADFTPARNAERAVVYNLAREYGGRLGAVVDINAAGSVSVRYWDTFWQTVATATDNSWHVGAPDFDQMLFGWLDGGARIRDHRIRFTREG